MPDAYDVEITPLLPCGLSVASPACDVDIDTAENFDGPDDTWTPEEMLLASVANCLALTFKAIAKAGRLEWQEIYCHSQGVLDKVERHVKFSRIETTARLVISSEADCSKAQQLLEKTEANCFVSNSLDCDKQFHFEIETTDCSELNPVAHIRHRSSPTQFFRQTDTKLIRCTIFTVGHKTVFRCRWQLLHPTQ